jgi:RecA-family ATPase
LATKGLVDLISFDKIQHEQVTWLWSGRIPLGKITILQGDPDLGKSTLAIDLAARVTRNIAMADDTLSDLDAPAGVVLMTAEDGLADTIRPRLDAAGADLTRVVTFGPNEHILFPSGVSRLQMAIQQAEARLVIVDPLAAFLDSSVNGWVNQDVRRALHPLKQIAESTGAAILLLDHLSKAAGRAAIYRGNGSVAFNAAARSVLLVGKHPEDSQMRVLARVKGNLCQDPGSLAYGIEQASNGSVRVAWFGQCELNADNLGEELQSERVSLGSLCAEWLHKRLADAYVAQTVVEAEAVANGFSKRTLQRARRALGVVSQKTGNSWTLSLPLS